MDVLRAEGEQLLKDVPFKSTERQTYGVLHIKSSRTKYANISFEDKTLSQAELRDFVDDATPKADIISTKIVRMHYHPDRGIESHSSLFRHVWRAFELDPYMIYMFHRNVPGFFQILSTSRESPLLAFYVNCQAHWLLWTYNPSTLSTNALLLSRSSPGGPAAYPHLRSRLERYSVLAGHPLFLALVAALDRLSYVDVSLRKKHKVVGTAERSTGFSHFYINKPVLRRGKAEAELDLLANLSRSASSVLVCLADMVQHLQTATAVVEAISSSSPVAATQGADPVMVRRETEIKDIAGVLSPQVKQRFGYVDYIRERAQNQLTVTFNLLARGDAETNIDIAKATMHDSTSMKTIAIMTMGFLPATLYAALFAIPSLQWDQPTVIGSRFWVYWAVTIPTTIAVFIIWFSMTYRERLWRRVTGRGRKAVERKKSVTEQMDTFP